MAKAVVDTSAFEYKDMFGNDIKVGDYIVYAGLADRSGVLRAGQIIELTYTKGGYGAVEPKVRARSWNNFRSRDGYDGNTRSGRQKDVSLGFLDRMIIVPTEQVSEKIKADLAGPICDWQGNPI
jgi:hypothetical protein